MFGDIGKILKIAGEMKTKLPALQARLAATMYNAQAGDGSVKAVVNGKGALAELHIEPSLLTDPGTTAQTLADTIRSAVASAQEEAARAAAEAMKEITGGMEIPGMTGL
jgi:DNA-binding protein YbaB